jgi:hypothetical protein
MAQKVPFSYLILLTLHRSDKLGKLTCSMRRQSELLISQMLRGDTSERRLSGGKAGREGKEEEERRSQLTCAGRYPSCSSLPLLRALDADGVRNAPCHRLSVRSVTVEGEHSDQLLTFHRLEVFVSRDALCLIETEV